jgi:hypothetical protein
MSDELAHVEGLDPLVALLTWVMTFVASKYALPDRAGSRGCCNRWTQWRPRSAQSPFFASCRRRVGLPVNFDRVFQQVIELAVQKLV